MFNALLNAVRSDVVRGKKIELMDVILTSVSATV